MGVKAPLITITDHYRAERADAASEKDAERAKERVWRTYAMACIAELARRSKGQIGGQVWRWRRARDDDSLPRPYRPFWEALSDEELAQLFEALIKAGYRGPPTSTLTNPCSRQIDDPHISQ